MKYDRKIMIEVFWYFLIGCIVIAVDQWSKNWAFDTGSASYTNVCIELIPIVNKGLAFSLLASNRAYVHAILVLIVFIFIFIFSLYTYWRYSLGHTVFAETLVLSGSISNLLDRIFYGGVLDFMTIGTIPNFNLPVGNIADCCIVGGLFYMAYEIISTWNEEQVLRE